MLNPHCLYKVPGLFNSNGVSYDTIVVDEHEVTGHCAEGWRPSLAAAVDLFLAAPAHAAEADEIAAHEAKPPTRDEMLAEAKRRGIKVDGRWSDAKLLSMLP